jgi:hypothetical protein
LLSLTSATFAASTPAPVSFHTDVMAVLSKAGCNAGACHGNRNGKGGFKLSLRGQDPAADFASLTRDLFGRRTNAIEPEKSLILLKPTTAISHQGGKRFAVDSKPYRILHDWIAQGMRFDDSGNTPIVTALEITPDRKVLVAPDNQVKITATAIYSDGAKRDVSDLAVYEQSQELAKVAADGLVTRGRNGEAAVVVRFLQYQQVVRLAFVPGQFVEWQPNKERNYIDTQIQSKLKELHINPSDACNDLQFMRRAYLDLLGILPTAQEARDFAADTSDGKRAKLVDALLDRSEYADFWALKWSDLLRNEERSLDRKGVQAFHHWIRQSVAENKPLNQFARELAGARGSTYLNPPANFYRAERDPLERGEDAAEVFLGVRLKCARCHNHPFDRWSQDDYYNWADVFGRLNYRVIENRRTDTNDKHEFIGEQFVYESDEGDLADPRPGHKTKPMLLGTGTTIADDQEDRLDALAQWMTADTNPFFARAQVNRIWFNLMGRGLVDPVDDFRATNPPSHPELLDALTVDFVKSGYDVRHMIRLIMSSQAYALSSTPNESNAEDEIDYSHNIPRRLAAEQMLDCQYEVSGMTASFTGYPKGMRAEQIPGAQPSRKPSAAEVFLTTFGKPPRELACECERSSDTTLGQTFQLISGREIGRMIAGSDNRIGKMVGEGKSDEQIIGDLYWTALTRAASDTEMKAMVAHVVAAKDRRAGLEDVLWALLNAKEFVLRS